MNSNYPQADLLSTTLAAIATNSSIQLASTALVASSIESAFANPAPLAVANVAPSFKIGTGKLSLSQASRAVSIKQQNDGKIVMAGNGYNGSDTDFSVIRLNSDGSLDTSFNSSGNAMLGFGAADTATSMQILSDGKIVVSGYSSIGGNEDYSVVRLNSDGSLDTSFNNSGKASFAVGSGRDQARGLAIDSNGKIILGGEAIGSTTNFALIRVNTNGTLDTSFNSNGKLLVPIGSSGDFGNVVAIQSDGKILLAGDYFAANGVRVAVIRVNPDGSLDTSFNSNGKVTLAGSSVGDYCTAIALQSDGKIVLSGYSQIGSKYYNVITRLNADGSLDTTFNSTGQTTISTGQDFAFAQSMTLQSDGKILVAGSSSGGGNYQSLLRLNSDGSLDTSFNGSGKLLLQVGSNLDAAYSVSVQSDGKILLGGSNSIGLTAVRLNSDGSLDKSFNAVNTLDATPTHYLGGSAVVLDSDVQIYDEELSLADNYHGSSLTLSRSGGANAEDVFSASSGLSFAGNKLTVGSTEIGSVSQSNGSLTLNFNANATQSLVNSALQKISYSNSNYNVSGKVKIDWLFNDGSGAGNSNVTGNVSVNLQANPVAPSTPTAPQLAAASDSGASSSDGYTKIDSPVFSGTVAPNLMVYLYDSNGTTNLGQTQADGAGNWSISSSTLSEGKHDVSIKTSYGAGALSSASSTYSVTIDKTAPAQVTSIGFTDDTGSSSTDLITKTVAQTIFGKLAANLQANETIQISLDNGGTWQNATGNVGFRDFSLSGQTLTASNTLKARVVDLAGNSSNETSFDYVLDTKAPLVSAITMSKTSLKAGETADVSISFNEKVINFDNADITVAKGTLTAVSSSDGGQTWSATFTPDADTESSSNALRIDTRGLTDLAGNAGTAISDSSNFTIDTKIPGATLTLDKTVLKQGDTAKLSLSFSEKVTGLTTADLSAAHGVVSGLTSSDGGTTWSATYTPNADTEASANLITLDNTGLTDLIGNPGKGTTQTATFSVDTKLPTVAITLDDTDLTQGESATVSFKFSEIVKGFDLADLTLSNASLGTLSSSDGGKTYTAILTPNPGIVAANNKISLKLAGVADLAGNIGSGTSASSVYAINTNTAPSLSGSKAAQTTLDTDTLTPFTNVTVTDPDIGASATISVKLDHAAKGSFTTASLAATGFSSSDGGLTYVHAAGTPAAIQAALRGLVFQPATGRVAVGASETTTFTISVNDGIAAAVTDSLTTVVSSATNLAPSAISLTNQQVDINESGPRVVGSLISVDPNPGDTHQYEVIGSTQFRIEGQQLVAINPSQLGLGEYAVLIRSTDAHGAAIQRTLSVFGVDQLVPQITSLSLMTGKQITSNHASFLVRFNKAVSGVDVTDFSLLKNGVEASLISLVKGDADDWILTLGNIQGQGSLGVMLNGTNLGISDAAGKPVSNPGFSSSLYAVHVDPNDVDGDSIPQAVELAVPNLLGQGQGDGNGDGVADATQTHVSSLRWHITPEQNQACYLSLSNQQQLAQSQVSTAPLPATEQSELHFDYGMLQAQSSGISRAGTLDFTLYSETLSAVNGLWLRDSAGHWNKVAAQIGSVAGRLKIDFSLQDGGQFDLDGLSNGSLNFQAALGYTKALVGKPGDADGDGIPDALEAANGTNPLLKDNAVHLRSDLFVKQLYRDVLYREADSAGLAYWQTQLDSGAINRQQMATSFMQQAEFQEIGSLARLYFGTFSRLPDREGLAYWIGQQKAGMALKDIAGSFVASSEFQSKFGNLDNSQFIDQVYQSVLQRSADAAGKSYWLTSLNAGASRGDVLMSFTESAEFKQVSQAKVSVTLDYLGLMGQVPDAASLAQLLQQNLSQPEIIGKLLDNPDYLARFM